MPLKESEIKKHLAYLNKKAKEEDDGEYPVSLYQVVDTKKEAKKHNKEVANYQWKKVAEKFKNNSSDDMELSVKDQPNTKLTPILAQNKESSEVSNKPLLLNQSNISNPSKKQQLVSPRQRIRERDSQRIKDES